MAAINELISQIDNPELRARIQKEVNKLSKQKKFGLVFEEHLPKCTPLYDIPVHKGAKVALAYYGITYFKNFELKKWLQYSCPSVVTAA